MLRHFIPFMMLVLPLLYGGQVEFTASRQPGLQIYQAKTVHGRVVVQLPDDMRPGETISGSVITEPAPSKDPEKMNRNRAALNALQFAFGGMSFLAGEQYFQAKLPAVPQALLTLAGKLGRSEIAWRFRCDAGRCTCRGLCVPVCAGCGIFSKLGILPTHKYFLQKKAKRMFSFFYG
ncbi:MAG TPA: hypothetical protein PLX49_08180 [Prolixibacteraceae bacterium]|nr:hypothetical protein [Prolixibacteraceae bacterium]